MKAFTLPSSSRFILAASVALLVASAATSQAVQATALINNGGTPQLLNFDTTTPGMVSAPFTISGFGAGEAVVGIDYRPIDSLLVAFTYATATGLGHVYTLTLNTGVATATSINANTLSLGTGLTRVMADFNPTANAIRLTTSGATNNDLRIPTGGSGALATDTDLNPANSGIRATAYSRNNAGGGTNGATTLYAIDGTNNALVTQGSVDFFTGNGTSPNTGALSTVATLSGVTGTNVVGFDIYNAPGTAASTPGSAFLATGTGGILTLNLLTGAATNAGTLGGTYGSVTDVAIVPEPTGLALLGLTAFGFAARRARRTTLAA